MITKEYIDNGYHLMMSYITDNRIKTKNRNFVGRLERFYTKFNANGGVVNEDISQNFLILERDFFNTVAPSDRSREEQALVEFLNIITKE